ncbi:MAG: YbjN domain-containing protein [Chloroflexi bacterium]|nr:YbjN domain-containing protein [Chloroflexota bacterium]
MANIHQAVDSFLNSERWAHDILAGQLVHRVFYQGDHARLICFAQAREEEQQLVFYSYCPETVPEDRRTAMAEFIARANYGLVLGNLELDFEDGELRFKTSIDVEGTELSPELIRPVLYANVLTMDQYTPAIMTVICGEATPAEAAATLAAA